MEFLKTIRFVKTNTDRIFIQLPMANPVIGSGKVSRKVRVVNPSGSKKWARKIKADRTRKSIPEKDREAAFGSIKVKQAFNHWKTLGSPMVSHSTAPTKTFQSSVTLLTKIIKTYELNEIIEAMDLAREVFNSDWFVYRKYISERKMSLPAFLIYSKSHKKLLPRRMRSIDSWMREFLLGRAYIEANYSVILKDKYPYVTEPLIEAWKTYTKQDYLEINESNGIVKLSQQIVKFVEANKNVIGELDIVDLIDQMLNKWDDRYKPKHIGWLLTPIFWQTKLPKALVKYGTFENKRDINLI